MTEKAKRAMRLRAYAEAAKEIAPGVSADILGLLDDIKTMRNFVELMLNSSVRYGTYDVDKLIYAMDELALMIGKGKVS